VHTLASKFIVFDGPEGCGKTTQTHLLKTRLEQQGSKVALFRDPGSTRIGERIRQILLNPDHQEMAMRCEMLLYMAARAQMMRELIIPALKDGATVICDRFVSSTLAYQLGGDGLTSEEIKSVANIAIWSRWPDLTLILDIPLERSSKRVQPKFMLPFPEDIKSELAREMTKDRIEQRSEAYHEQVRQNYLRQAADDPAKYHVINADRQPGDVAEDIWEVLQKRFE
jgi:dTMP kinase